MYNFTTEFKVFTNNGKWVTYTCSESVGDGEYSLDNTNKFMNFIVQGTGNGDLIGDFLREIRSFEERDSINKLIQRGRC